MAVAAGDCPGERDPGRVYEKVMLGAYLALSTGLGPVAEPPFSPAHDCRRRRHATIRSRLRISTRRVTVRAVAPRRRPAATHPAAATGRAAAEAEFGSADAATRSPCATRTRSPAAPAGQAAACGPETKAPLSLRQQRFDPLPQPVRHDPRRNSHRHPLDLDDGCRQHSSSTSGSLLHYGSSS